MKSFILNALINHKTHTAVRVIKTLTVNGKLFVSKCLCNHNGDKLFRELIRTVVV